jgi:hypothetical protein
MGLWLHGLIGIKQQLKEDIRRIYKRVKQNINNALNSRIKLSECKLSAKLIFQIQKKHPKENPKGKRFRRKVVKNLYKQQRGFLRRTKWAMKIIVEHIDAALDAKPQVATRLQIELGTLDPSEKENWKLECLKTLRKEVREKKSKKTESYNERLEEKIKKEGNQKHHPWTKGQNVLLTQVTYKNKAQRNDGT